MECLAYFEDLSYDGYVGLDFCRNQCQTLLLGQLLKRIIWLIAK